MGQIVLTEDQAQLLESAGPQVQVCDPQGNLLGYFVPLWTAEEIAKAKQALASPGPWYTGEQIQSRLRALQEEWDRKGGFDEAHMHRLLEQLDVADPGHMRAEKIQ